MNENGFTMEECHEAYKILIKDLKKKEKFAKMVKLRKTYPRRNQRDNKSILIFCIFIKFVFLKNKFPDIRIVGGTGGTPPEPRNRK